MISAALFLLAVGQPARATVEPLRINGLVAATFTPFSKDGSVNTKEAENQAQWLNATGVKWIFLSGTTGESLKLSMEERLAQAELWLKLAPTYGIRVIVHTGAESIPVAKALTRHAVANGADAIGAMPPVFFKPVNTQALAATMASIAAEAPKLPFYYYHIPSMTGVAFPDGMLGLAQEMEKLGVSNFAGVKYTGLYTYPGMMDAVKLLNYKQGKFEVLCGRDELMIEALTAGIVGFVGSQYNFAGDLYNSIRSSFSNGDMQTSRQMQLEAIELISTWQNVSSGVNGCKNVMNGLLPGVTVTVGGSRLPSVPITGEDSQKLAQGLKNWCKGSFASKVRMCQAGSD